VMGVAIDSVPGPNGRGHWQPTSLNKWAATNVNTGKLYLLLSSDFERG